MLRSGNNFDLLLPTKLRSHLQNSWEPVFRPSRFEAPLTTLSARGYAGSDLLSVAYWVPGAGPGLMAINRPLAKRPRIRSLDEQRAQHSGRTELNFETGCVIGPAIFASTRVGTGGWSRVEVGPAVRIRLPPTVSLLRTRVFAGSKVYPLCSVALPDPGCVKTPRMIKS
jgi:hypothetical protein